VLISVYKALSRQRVQTQLGYMGIRPHLFHILLLCSWQWGRYQIIQLGDRGTCVWTTCPGLLRGTHPVLQ